jgi:hypothetical protein
MAPRNVGLNSTFNEQRLVINALSVDLDNLSNAGFLTASNLVGYATQGYVNNSIVGFITSGALTGYATEGYVVNSLVGYATQGYVNNSLVGYATQGYVDNAVVGFITSGALIGYATEGYVNNQGFVTSGIVVGYATEGYVNNQGFVTSGIVVGYATEGYVNNAVVGFVTSSALSGYATEGYVNNVVVGYATQGYVDTQIGIRTFSGNYNDLTNKPYIPVNINDLSDVNAGGPSTGQVLKWSGSEWQAASDLTASGAGIGLSDLSVTIASDGISSLSYSNVTGVFLFTPTDLTGYATTTSIVGFVTTGALSGYATEGYVNNQGFVTSGIVVGYATEGYVNNQGFVTSGIVVGYATEGYVNNALVGFITSGSLSGYATEGYVNNALVGFITSGSLSGYATEGYVNNQGFVTSGIVVGYATEGYVDNSIVGFITSGSSGSNLTGIVTYITAGSGTSVDQNTGNVTITVTSSPYSTSSGYATIAGISTSAGTATTATNLSDAANIVTGTINKDRISTTNGLTVLGDLYVSNNISFGGTTTQLNTQQLQIVDADIVLGIGTTFNSNDNTANHGGIAIASTEGTPLVDLNIVPAETNPSTYKKIMWFKGSTIGSGITDAWLFNYGVGIGSTQVPNGVRLAAGGMQVSDSTISSPQLSISGVSTFTNGPLLIGAATSTGTASQRLQVTGGAYVSGNIGIAITNPSTKLHVVGDSTVSGVTNLNQVTETVVNAFNTTLSPSTGTLTVDTSQGTVVLGDLNASVTTWAFTNVPTANSKATTITLIIDGDTAQTYGDACNVNGSAVSGGVKWAGGSAPTATNNFDIITFTIVKDSAGTINVFGSGNTDFS